jgi:hypothetical protein
MEGHVARMWEIRNAYSDLHGIPESNTSLVRLSLEIMIILKDIWRETVFWLSNGFFEDGYEPSSSVKDGEFLD